MNWSDSIHRSLRSWAADAVGSPPWRVRLASFEVADGKRPAMFVETVAPAVTTFARATKPQGDIRRMAPFVLTAFPVMLDDEGVDLSAPECRSVANAVGELLSKAVDLGVVQAGLTERQQAVPMNVPIFDFTGVPIEGTAEERKRPEHPVGFASIDEAAVNVIADQDDARRFTVTLDVRLSWDEPGRAAPNAGVIARSMPGGWVEHGELGDDG